MVSSETQSSFYGLNSTTVIRFSPTWVVSKVGLWNFNPDRETTPVVVHSLLVLCVLFFPDIKSHTHATPPPASPALYSFSFLVGNLIKPSVSVVRALGLRI